MIEDGFGMHFFAGLHQAKRFRVFGAALFLAALIFGILGMHVVAMPMGGANSMGPMAGMSSAPCCDKGSGGAALAAADCTPTPVSHATAGLAAEPGAAPAALVWAGAVGPLSSYDYRPPALSLDQLSISRT